MDVYVVISTIRSLLVTTMLFFCISGRRSFMRHLDLVCGDLRCCDVDDDDTSGYRLHLSQTEEPCPYCHIGHALVHL